MAERWDAVRRSEWGGGPHELTGDEAVCRPPPGGAEPESTLGAVERGQEGRAFFSLSFRGRDLRPLICVGRARALINYQT